VQNAPESEEQQVLNEMVDQEQVEQHKAVDPANQNTGKHTKCTSSFIACNFVA
jgi:hypothetical protein